MGLGWDKFVELEFFLIMAWSRIVELELYLNYLLSPDKNVELDWSGQSSEFAVWSYVDVKLYIDLNHHQHDATEDFDLNQLLSLNYDADEILEL